jgi:hypothetical protein
MGNLTSSKRGRRSSMAAFLGQSSILPTGSSGSAKFLQKIAGGGKKQKPQSTSQKLFQQIESGMVGHTFDLFSSPRSLLYIRPFPLLILKLKHFVFNFSASFLLLFGCTRSALKTMDAANLFMQNYGRLFALILFLLLFLLLFLSSFHFNPLLDDMFAQFVSTDKPLSHPIVCSQAI